MPEFLLFSPYYAVSGKAHTVAISPCAMPPGGATDLLLLTPIEHSQEPEFGCFCLLANVWQRFSVDLSSATIFVQY